MSDDKHETDERVKTPAYYDFEMERRKWRRIVWSAVLGLGGISLVISCASIFVALVAVNRPVPVVVFDSAGKPIVFSETTRPGIETDLVRVKHFVETFVDAWVCVDSTRIDRDMQEALSMMTRPLQDAVMTDVEAVRRRDEFRDGNVRSRVEGMEMRIGDFDADDPTQQIGVYTWGRLMYEPIIGDGAAQERYTLVTLHIERTPVTEATPYGLLVAYSHYFEFETSKELERALIKLRQS